MCRINSAAICCFKMVIFTRELSLTVSVGVYVCWFVFKKTFDDCYSSCLAWL